MIFKFLPFILMTPFSLWCLYNLYTLRQRFWYAVSILAMALSAFFGAAMFFNMLVVV